MTDFFQLMRPLFFQIYLSHSRFDENRSSDNLEPHLIQHRLLNTVPLGTTHSTPDTHNIVASTVYETSVVVLFIHARTL